MTGELEIIAHPGKQEIVLTREFDAPRELVFRAWLEPELLARWLGPDRLVMEIVEMDSRSGGSWRFIHREPDGSAEYGFHGIHHDVTPPARIIRTFEFEGCPGHVQLETLLLEDAGGRTRMTAQSVFQSVEDRDGMIASGMESGVREGFARLDELLKELR
jgi:uncharacterized protein YndB with AHSA1/START domain